MSFENALAPQYGDPHPVPLIVATAESLQGYGKIVKDFKTEQVEIIQWPRQGWRPIVDGMGRSGGIVQGLFKMEWDGDLCKGVNMAVGGNYVTGRLPRDVNPTNRTHVLVRELNYHPDGGQVFFPADGGAFVALLALPGDDIKLSDFVAFYCDGAFGVQIHANIWHQAMYPVNDSAVFMGKQGAVHAVVAVDTVEEFGKYLKVPLVTE